MLLLAGLIGDAVLTTSAFATCVRIQDPVSQWIAHPESQPIQLSLPITEIEDHFPALVPKGVGIKDRCIRPVHTVVENAIQGAYSRPYDFTLGHFMYYWLGNDLLQYDTKVYVNGTPHTARDIRDIVLAQGEQIRLNS